MAVERVQSAIARARAQRDGLDQAPEADEPEVMADVEARATTLDRWPDLPRVAVAEDMLDRARVIRGGAEATAFDMLRTKVLQRMKGDGWRRIAITSADKGCGKTTVAMNLAFSLARQKEVRTLLVEADLRRPSLARALGLPGASGLAEVLTQDLPFGQAALRLRDNLAVLASQARSAHSAEILQSGRVADVLAEIEAAYNPDIVIFDLPPLMETDDALAFMGHVDCALLVTRAEHTTSAQVETCSRDISARTALAGVVLNRYRAAGAASGY